MNKIRLFTGFFTGNIAFFVFYSGLCWVLAALNITPYGRFVAMFFKGRKPEEAKAAIEANKEVFERMLDEASRFSNLFITPSAGLLMGFIIGIIISSRDEKTLRPGVIWSVVSALPVAALFWIKSGAEPYRLFYIVLFLALTGAGGAIGGLAASRLFSQKARD